MRPRGLPRTAPRYRRDVDVAVGEGVATPARVALRLRGSLAGSASARRDFPLLRPTHLDTAPRGVQCAQTSDTTTIVLLQNVGNNTETQDFEP